MTGVQASPVQGTAAQAGEGPGGASFGFLVLSVWPRRLAPVVHGVGWDGHGRGHGDGGATHGELAVDCVVGTGATATAALGTRGACGAGRVH